MLTTSLVNFNVNLITCSIIINDFFTNQHRYIYVHIYSCQCCIFFGFIQSLWFQVVHMSVCNSKKKCSKKLFQYLFENNMKKHMLVHVPFHI
jgi:hypothetical protein